MNKKINTSLVFVCLILLVTFSSRLAFAIDMDGDGYDDLIDCIDTNPDIHPGATETCDGVDNDCDGLIDDFDPGITGQHTYYLDYDFDMYGSAETILACSKGVFMADVDGDCNDASPFYYPGALEICTDTEDYNCDGELGEPITFYRDDDGDGYGVGAWTAEGCEETMPGYARVGGDCNDSSTSFHPDADEVCGDPDYNCDEETSSPTLWFPDEDLDGYGDNETSTSACVAPDGYVAIGLDCDDTNATINPGVAEICDDGIDNDCDFAVDESGRIYYPDADEDGFGDPSGITVEFCVETPGYVSDATDCDDTLASIYPSATEICGNSIDEDCDGVDLVCPVVMDTDDEGDDSGDDDQIALEPVSDDQPEAGSDDEEETTVISGGESSGDVAGDGAAEGSGGCSLNPVAMAQNLSWQSVGLFFLGIWSLLRSKKTKNP